MKDDILINIVGYIRNNNPIIEFYFDMDDRWVLEGQPNHITNKERLQFINLPSFKMGLYTGRTQRTCEFGRTIWQELQEVGFKILKNNS